VAGDHRSDDELLEVGVRGVHEATRLGCGKHGGGVGGPSGDEVRALQRVHRDVHARGRIGIADLLADEQHRRLVALSLADDDGAADVGVVHRLAHGGHRGLVGSHPVAASHEARGGDGARLGCADGIGDDQLIH
jgi:hypothetical protein